MSQAENAAQIRWTDRLSRIDTRLSPWHSALRWGVTVALIHRVLLMAWAAVVWLTVQPYIPFPPDVNPGEQNLPALEAPLLANTFGVWRRWDATHYLDLATSGYRADNPGPTVFGILTPFSFYAADQIIPGPVDLAAALVETVAFATALTLLYRFVESYYGDPALARMTVTVTALIPISYFFAAPMSESLYLASVLLFFYAALRGRWKWTAVGGVLATLARSQGAALAGIGAVIVIQRAWQRRESLAANVWRVAMAGWPLIAIPLGYFFFLAYRQALELPPLGEVYRTESFVFFTDPISGLYWTLRHLVEHPCLLLTEADFQAIPLCFGLAALMLRDSRHRRLPMVLYVWVYLLLFFTKVNWTKDTDIITSSQSVARYALALFPLTVVFSDRVMLRLPPRSRAWALLGLFTLLLITSARHVLYFAGP